MAKFTNQFKAFIAYAIANIPDEYDPEALPSQDPSGGQWSTMGFIEPLPGLGESMVAMPSGVLFAIQFNDRMLPAKVRDERVKAMVARLEAQQGRKVGKREYAEIREQIEFDLLPQAFIKRTVVYASMRTTATHGSPLGKHSPLLVFTSSQRRADQVVALIHGMLSQGDSKPAIHRLELAHPGVLTSVTRGAADLDGYSLNNAAVLKGEGKRAIRIKGADLESTTINTLVERDDMRVTEVALWKGNDPDKRDLEFSVTESLIFKGIVIPDVKTVVTEDPDDFEGLAELCVVSCRRLLFDFVAAAEGFAEIERPADNKAAAAQVDDDEL